MSGCHGMGGRFVRTIRPDGKPIAGASVALVVLPEGGAEEVERRVRAHEPLDGWMATTDEDGKAQLSDDSKKALKRKQAVEPTRFVFSESRRAYERELTQAGETSPQTPALDLGNTVGLVVLAEGYDPYVGTASLGRKGLLPKVILTTLAGREPSQQRESATVTLEPVRKIAAGTLRETATGDDFESAP
jgi:hypothetical protein